MKLNHHSKFRAPFIFFGISCLILISCQKDFLDKKSDKALLVPTTLNDFQALLNNVAVMNSAPSLNMIAGDEFYTTDDALNSLGAVYEINTYSWAEKDPYQGAGILDWEVPYKQVFYANVVLEGLEKITPNAAVQNQWNQMKGNALFFRAMAFYNLAQEFAKPYTRASAIADPGIPLRLNSDVKVKSVRASVQETYDRIIADLNAANLLLPQKPVINTMPSQSAVNALLSRIYLGMGDYANAKRTADDYLAANSRLIDYNSLTAVGINPFAQAVKSGNDEVVFYADLLTVFFDYTPPNIDPVLYNSYQANDLRKSFLFLSDGAGGNSLIGDYTGCYYRHFGGLATDEVYLNRAECFARNKDVQSALKDLNFLLVNRYRKGFFIPVALTDADEVLAMILMERRKELIARGTRWSDLRRMNQDARYARTLSRTINGKLITLPPNDNRYVFPIPDNEIAGSGLIQNPR